MNAQNVKASASLQAHLRQEIAEAVDFSMKRLGFRDMAAGFNVSGIIVGHIEDPPLGSMKVKSLTSEGTLNCVVHTSSIVVEGFLVVRGGEKKATEIMQKVADHRRLTKQRIERKNGAGKKTSKPNLSHGEQRRSPEASGSRDRWVHAIIERAQNTLSQLVEERSRLETLRSRFASLLAKASPSSPQRERLQKDTDVLSKDVQAVADNIKSQEEIIRVAHGRLNRDKR